MKTKQGKSRLDTPLFINDARELATYIKSLSTAQFVNNMKISEKLALHTKQQYKDWTHNSHLTAAALAYKGDIYSGLQAQDWSSKDEQFAQKHLRILSGLYGILRPLDAIAPYRLEMGYRLPSKPYDNLYTFWGKRIASSLPAKGVIINLSAVEYSKTVTPYIDSSRIITPRFLSVDPTTNQPKFVVVHAKIARGAFANWLIKNKITETKDITQFNALGYTVAPQLSTQNEPVFICTNFKGKGLSIRKTE